MKMRKSEHFIRSSSSIQGQAFNVKMNDKMFETLLQRGCSPARNRL